MKLYLPFLASLFILILFGSFGWNAQNSPKVIPASPDRIEQDSSFDEAAELAALRKKIEGREKDPAEEVFENIQILKGFPANRVLAIMKMGFGNSLGVSCDHCHVTDDWASEEKTTKQVTRDMWEMVGTINGELLKNIPNLESAQPGINCTTCHRGEVKPATNMKK